jgi:hypothetical protein
MKSNVKCAECSVKSDVKCVECNMEKHMKRQRELDKKEKALRIMQEDLDRREHMFNMQWKLLEHELSLFAKEREEFEKEKKKHKYKAKIEKEKRLINNSERVNAGMYFLGVHDELSLKKRYRDLLKLFHPDSMNGDVDAMQAINKEYSELKRKYEEI